MSDEKRASAQASGEGRAKGQEYGMAHIGAKHRSAGEKQRERLAFERFVERSLHEAYEVALRQEVPARFIQLLERLNAAKETPRKGAP
ncbi:hypothetical protein SAMN05444161_2027 [Rhizobiales bacterium GAS191]|nr:hypothetical protein SAMN05519103_01139 [Rhizobiales bacterium GAS113]SEC88113.1 hypothetical protein SAMN05444161_2027 [Rhizobiales bacterium GAS191]